MGFLRLVSLVLYCLVVLVLDFGLGFDCVCFCCFVLIFGGLDLWFVSKRVGFVGVFARFGIFVTFDF